MLRDIPTGTVTFLFTDVEGSTKRLRELGAAEYAQALTDHRRILREAFSAHRGVEVDTQGDAFFVAFSNVADAISAAQEVQGADGPLRVRIGIHTGEPQLGDEGYVGLDVHRAARICSAAHGGQVIVSERTKDLLEGTAELLDLGLHRLKDLGPPEKLFQLGNDPFPPLRSLNATNLPSQPGPLIGRDRELSELAALVREKRVVTLTGPGGSGKTRLALHAAAESVDEFVDGVFWVPLASVTDAEILEPTMGQTLGAENGVAEHVDEKKLLLVLDNLEQLLPGAAPHLAKLHERCPNLRLLLTSRAPLRIASEREYPVDPLLQPDAVTLFRQRAFVSEPEDAVREICRRLDGLPLAIELAAARTRVLPPDQLLARLEQALPVLTGGLRDAPERQRTLRAAIEWSYDLLSPAEQRLFARLGAFAGSFTHESAEAVCEVGLDGLESLVEQSLLRRWDSGRLGMLETIRELAVEKLDHSGGADAVRRRHAEHYFQIAQSANLGLEALGHGPQRHELASAEQHNFRAAMDWATAADADLGLRLAVSLENFWITHDPAEGARRFEALLKRAGGVELGLRARSMIDYGGCLDQSGDYDRARAATTRAGELFREAGDERGIAEADFRLGVVASRMGDNELAARLWQKSRETWQRLGYTVGEVQALGNLGGYEFEHGDPERGRELTERSLALARDLGWTWWEAGQLINLAEYFLKVGRTDEAERHARDSLRLARVMEDRMMTVFALGSLAWAATDRGDPDRAVLLWAAIEAEEARGPLAWWAQYRDVYAAHIPPVDDDVTRMTLEEAVAYALEERG